LAATSLANNPKINADSTPTSMTITAYQNETTINTDWIRFFSRHRSRTESMVAIQLAEGQNDPADLYGFDGLVRYQPKADPATSISSHRVNRTADGRLLGRIHQLNSLSGRPVDVRIDKSDALSREMRSSRPAARTTTAFSSFAILPTASMDWLLPVLMAWE
jgi:hypothetical protein